MRTSILFTLAAACAALILPGAVTGTPSVPATPFPHFSASIVPNPPTVGENMLDITVTDARGQSITGLKLSSTVAMMSMDMGTAHPGVKELGGGKYRITVNFMMEGPWRVTLQAGSVTQSLDFHLGGKAPWAMPKTAANAALPVPPSAATQAPVSPPSAANIMQSMADMPRMSTATPPATASPAYASSTMEGHSASAMPQLQAFKIVTVSGNEDWKTSTGFGKNAPMVAMMAQMMVGGSPMESMKMGVMKMDFSDANYTPDDRTGPRRVSTTVIPNGAAPVSKSFDFDVK